MATYSVTTTVIQEAIITWVVAQVNADRAKQTPPLPPYASNGAYLLDKLTNMFQGWKLQYEKVVEIDPLREKWPSLTQAQKDQIKTIAGV